MGHRVTVFFVSLLLLLVLAAAGGDRLTIQVQVNGRPSPDYVSLTAAPAEAVAGHGRFEADLVNDRAQLEVTRVSSDALRLLAEAPGYWAPAVDVDADAPEPVTVGLWPASALVASFQPAEYAEELKTLQLHLQPVTGTASDAMDQPTEAHCKCRVFESSLEHCVVPSGSWHMRMDLEGYVPEYRWNVQLEPGKVIDLGDITLRKGASVFGRAVTEAGPVDPREAWVELRPLIDLTDASQETVERLEQMTYRASVNEWGYFLFSAVDPRAYELSAHQKGFIPATLSRLVVASEQENELKDPLVLQRALHLTVVVDPPEYLKGEPWRISLLELNKRRSPKTVAGGLTDLGQWTSPPLPADSYLVKVFDTTDNRMASQEIELVEDQTIRIESSHVFAFGSVVLDDEPLPSKVYFGGRFGAVRVKADTDEEGAFTAVLPSAGRWTLDVVNEEEGIFCRGLEVEVPETMTEGLVIEVPDTWLEGEVVDRQGSPVPEATVIATMMKKESPGKVTTASGHDGRFRVGGLKQDIYYVEARDGDRSSGPQRVQIEEGSTSPPLRLVLRESWVLRGAVLSASRPVQQALVLGYSFTAQGTPAGLAIQETRSKLDGSFELLIPEEAAYVRVLTLALGFTLHVMQVTKENNDSQSPVEIVLNRTGGTLKLSGETGIFRVVVVDGMALDGSVITRWAVMNGSERNEDDLVVPSMPQGAYQYCDLTKENAFLVLGGAVPPPGPCAEGYLSRHGDLVLSVS